MPRTQVFRPDWASAPGDTIADLLQERHISLGAFAASIECTEGEAISLLEGRATITIELARRLERAFGASVEFWLSRDYQYREDAERIHATDEQWARELPIGDMIKFGWLTPPPRPSEEVSACLRFFGVPNIPAWREAYSDFLELAAFRTSPSFESRPAAVAAWLRRGELEAESIGCNPWNARRFRDSLSHVRPLTREKKPSVFIPELQRLCAESGVAVAVVRAPTGCRASGATRFLTPDRALLLLSFRYLTDDQFWFTFFHEAGHLVLHGQRQLFLEGADLTSNTEEEREANDFAARTLVPAEFQIALGGLTANAREVIGFSRRLGVSSGIVVGQLQHMRRIRRNQLNNLKRRFVWEA